MTQLTDVPQSGIYYQEGAVVELVLQLVDIQTGEPIQLQSASGLYISVLYPDGTTSQTFAASLYTDGSDGYICYTTVGSDLSQSGLYQMQGGGTISGVAIPPSYPTDFYVLKNVTGTAPQPPSTPTALIGYDSNGTRWAVTVDTSGEFVFAALATGPANAIQFNTLVMKDDDGVCWTVTIDPHGFFSATDSGENFSHAINYFTLADANGISWICKISTAGIVGAA